MLDLLALVQQCAPTIGPQTMLALVQVESNNNPYAIGVVDGNLIRQPKSYEEALVTVHQLERDGWNFSVGLGQVNRKYLTHHNISYSQAFQPCTNLGLSAKILQSCYVRAKKTMTDSQQALSAALSCYYSGNFWRGFQSEGKDKQNYVQKVVACADQITAIPVVPSIKADKSAKNPVNNTLIPPQSIPSDHASILIPSKTSKKEDDAKSTPSKPNADSNETNKVLVF